MDFKSKSLFFIRLIYFFLVDKLEADNKSSKVGGEEIKNYLNNFEQTAKQDFSNMRKDFSDAFKEIDYKFELEDLKLNEQLKLGKIDITLPSSLPRVKAPLWWSRRTRTRTWTTR